MSTIVNNSGVSDAQRIAIVELVSGSQKRDAARAAGVEPGTLSRWQREAEFQAAWHQAQQDAYTAAIQQLRTLQQRALDELDTQFDSPELDAADRRQLALSVLRLAVRLPPPTGSTDAAALRWEFDVFPVG